MIYCFDTYYTEDFAHTAVIGIENWEDEQASFELKEIIHEINEYESGAFYKRELPCLLSILQKIELNPEKDLLLIDGYVHLSNEGKLGLGGHLYEALDQSIPIIGVAKNDFVSLEKGKIAVFRGVSKKALFVTAVGIDLEEVSQKIKDMHGENRMPTILKLVDQKSREF